MSIEVIPTIACNLKCVYCYQDNMRIAGNFGVGRINLEKTIETIKKANEGADTPEFSIFGGEPLLLGKLTLERLWGFGLKEYDRNGIQTNGELIDDEFLMLFVKYKVSVGISIDGPWPLNNARSTEEGTIKSLSAIDRLNQVGIRPNLHVILNKNNASKTTLPILIDWIKDVEKKVSEIRFHLLEVDTEKGQAVALSDEENETAFLSLASLETRAVLQPFKDMRLLISRADERVGCTWNGCDPYTTPAVQGVDGDGTLSNCGRVNKDGVAYRKGDQGGDQRIRALYVTDYRDGGCKDCRYFFACKGQCPGEAIDGDWRNRSQHCRAYYVVFEKLENEVGIIPEEKIKKYEQLVFGSNYPGSPHGDSHGDSPHTDRNVLRVPVVVK